MNCITWLLNPAIQFLQYMNVFFYQAEQGEDYDEDAEEAEEEEEANISDQLIVTQAVIGDSQTYQAENTGQIHLANINGQQVQVLSLQLRHLFLISCFTGLVIHICLTVTFLYFASNVPDCILNITNKIISLYLFCSVMKYCLFFMSEF